MYPSQVQDIHEGLNTLRRMVGDLENKQKTVLGVALPEEGESLWGGAWGGHSAERDAFSVGMKKELQTLRDEIKTLAGQIQRKLKGESWSHEPLFLFQG